MSILYVIAGAALGWVVCFRWKRGFPNVVTPGFLDKSKIPVVSSDVSGVINADPLDALIFLVEAENKRKNKLDQLRELLGPKI